MYDFKIGGALLAATVVSLGTVGTAATIDELTSSSLTTVGTVAAGVVAVDSATDTTTVGSASTSIVGQSSAESTVTDTGVITGSLYGELADGEEAHRASTVATMTQTETNNSGGDQTYDFDFFLSGMAIDLHGDSGGAGFGVNPLVNDQTSAIGAFVDYRVLVNGVEQAVYHAELYGGGGTYALGSMTGLTGSLVGQSTDFAFGFNGGERLVIDDVLGSLDLGTLADGESVTVSTVMTLGYVGNGYENFISAYFGDPNQVSALGITGTPVTGGGGGGVSPVPLPAAAWLLGLGVASFGVMRRRKAA